MHLIKKFLILLLAAITFAPLSARSADKNSDSYAMARGKEEMEKQNYQDALDWFNQELTNNPGNGEALLYVSVINYRSGEYGASLTAIDRALKKLPKKDRENRALSYNVRAFVNLALEDTVAALDDLAAAIKANPDETESYSDRGNLYYQMRQYDLSDADYARLAEMRPGDTMGYMGRGRNAVSRRNPERAIELFSKAVKLAPGYASGYAFRAEPEIMLGRWIEATDDIIRALDIDQDDKAFFLLTDSLTAHPEATDIALPKLKIQSAKQPKEPYWPYVIGLYLENIGRYAEAIGQYDRAFELDPNSLFCFRTARCLILLDKADKALAYIDRGHDMAPDDSDFVVLRAQALRALRRFDDALAEIDRYVAIAPDDSQAYYQRALLRMAAGLYADAAKDFATATLLQPDVDTMDFFLLRRADALRLSGKIDDARPYYIRITELDSVPSANRALAFSGLELPDMAVAEIDKVLASPTDASSRDSDIYDAMCLYARLGRTDKAVEYLDSVAARGKHTRSSLLTDYDLRPMLRDPEFRNALDKAFPAPVADDEVTEEIVAVDTVLADTPDVVEVPFTRESGVTKVKCTINGLPLYFVFDTGASDVTLSMVEANFMLKNDFISPDDVVGTARYVDANGDISEGTVINLRKVNFGGLELDNVRASVVRNQKAPLLLGQSVLGRLGSIEIDNRRQKLTITRRK